MDKIQQIRDFIERVKIEEAIYLLLSLNTQYNDTIRTLQTQYSKYKIDSITGLEDSKDFIRITSSLLKVTSTIEKEAAAKPNTMGSEVSQSADSGDSNTEDISKPIPTILIYDSEDTQHVKKVRKHLFGQIRSGNIQLFDIHKDVPPTANREEYLKNQLENSALVLLFVSSNLFETELALEAEKYVGTKRIVPIRLTPFNLSVTKFKKLQGLPLSGKAISEYTNQDSVLYDISISISALINDMLK